jgi:TetR/AcrR family transcriptional repressor of nem operon
MARPSNRDRILTEGLKVVHARGFNGASVRDIVQAAGVPQGSFTNHFASKEAFGLEIIDLYLAHSAALIAETLRNDALPPLARLRAFLAANGDPDAMRNGCLLGNFAAEVCEQSDALRERVAEVLGELVQAVAYCLKAAVATGELPAGLDVESVAGFVVAGLQGARLMAKVERDAAPLARFEQVLFGSVLR